MRGVRAFGLALLGALLLTTGCGTFEEGASAAVKPSAVPEPAASGAPGATAKTPADPLRFTPLRGRVDGLRMGHPIQHRRLTVYPIVATKVRYARRILTSGAALRGGTLRARKIGDDFRRVALDNQGEDPVFMMDGEMIRGADQDRMLMQTALLAPRRQYTLGAYCTEQGRFDSDGHRFRSVTAIAPQRLRIAALTMASQGKVWDAIRRKIIRLGGSTTTDALRAAYRGKQARRHAEGYLAALRQVTKRFPKAIGAIAVVDGMVSSLDLFANPDLFARIWPRLALSYVIDSLDPAFVPSNWPAERLADFIAEAGNAGYHHIKTRGMGVRYAMFSPRVQGTLLIADDAVIHLAYFPDRKVRLPPLGARAGRPT